MKSRSPQRKQLLFIKRKRVFLILFLLGILFSQPSHAFSVLTHEALIDANWKTSLLPALRERFPLSTEEELEKARAFAYGGAIAPDMGYFPFGSEFFTNLIHYVRSGDFVNNLIRDAANVNEYAFALGVACHYMADKYGHSMATNRSVPLAYPDDKIKFGPVVTYEEDKLAHLRVEFGFDVLQTARGSYIPQSYHNFIGFSIADSLMATAFEQTYGLKITKVFPKFSLALGTFRWTVRNLFPALTKAAWITKKKEIREKQPGLKAKNFIYRMHRREYFSEYGREREKPRLGATILSFFIRIMPKVGKLRSLKFKTPGPESEKLFISSFDTVLVHYASFIEAAHRKQLIDIDFDTGQPTNAGEYCLCDQTYDALLLQLGKEDFAHISNDLRNNIIAFYKSNSARSRTNNPACGQVLSALNKLKELQAGSQ